jgi:hypothetical protein
MGEAVLTGRFSTMMRAAVVLTVVFTAAAFLSDVFWQ